MNVGLLPALLPAAQSHAHGYDGVELPGHLGSRRGYQFGPQSPRRIFASNAATTKARLATGG